VDQSRITVTAVAFYLVLEQLVDDEGIEFLLAVLVLRHQSYVDDCAFGVDDQILAQTRDQLIELLKKGDFCLWKCKQHHRSIVRSIPDHGLATHNVLQDEHLKVLGILWNPKLDIFQFRVTVIIQTNQTSYSVNHR